MLAFFWQEQSYLLDLLSDSKHLIADLQQRNIASSSASDPGMQTHHPGDGRTIVSSYEQRDVDARASSWVQYRWEETRITHPTLGGG